MIHKTSIDAIAGPNVGNLSGLDRASTSAWIEAPPPFAPWLSLLLGAAVVTLTGAIRLVRLNSLQQISVDEVFYMNLGHSVAHGRIPPTFPIGEGNPHRVFLLHPPGFFVLEAVWERIAGRPLELVAEVTRARELNTVLAMVTAGLLIAVGLRVGGIWTGLGAGVLFAFDPFIIRQNGMVLLETATVMWVVAGLYVLVRVASGASTRPRAAAVGGGMLFGLAMLSKDLAAVETVGPLVAAAVFQWGLRRREALIASIASIVPYLSYVVACAGQGDLGQLYSQKTLGIRRALGLSVSTGFNKPGAPSLTGTLASQVLTFGGSYLLVGVGTVCAVWLLWRARRPEQRFVGLVTVFAAVLLGYSAAFGTIEEQFLYFLTVPAVLSTVLVVPLALSRVWERRSRRDRVATRKYVVMSTSVAMVIATGFNAQAWGQELNGANDQIAQLLGWMHHNVPAGATVAYAEGVVQFSVETDGYRPVPLGLPSTMVADSVHYFIVIPREIQEHYSFIGTHTLEFYSSHATVVFQSTSNQVGGSIEVLRTTDPQVW